MNAPFEGKPAQCRGCFDIIKSSYPGEFVTCKCGAISVDQKNSYSRYVGHPGDFEMNPEDFVKVPKE